MPDSFAELLKRAQDGEGEALSELLTPYLSAITAYVRLRLPKDVSQRESSADIVQSVCGQVIADLPALKAANEIGFKAWLYRVVAHEITDKIDRHRAGRRDVARELPGGIDSRIDNKALIKRYGMAVTPSKHVGAKEEIARIEKAFSRLPEDYRDVILHVSIAGLSYGDAATIMDRSEDSVRQLIHRARARLATLLDGQGTAD